MGRLLGRPCSLEDLESALRNIGEEPSWKELPRGQFQYKSSRFKAVVNIWTSTGTIHVQGGGAAELEDPLRAALEPSSSPVIAEPLPANGGRSIDAAAVSDALLQTAAWHVYVDGSCPLNGLSRSDDQVAVRAGWGVAIYSQVAHAEGATEANAAYKLHGSVVIHRCSPLNLGAEVATNNTAELSSVGEALWWLLKEAPGPTSGGAVIYYDSQYAANIVTGRNVAHKNVDLADCVRKIYNDVILSGRPLMLSHVRGHTKIIGNELADKLAAKGAKGEWSSMSKRWSDVLECKLSEAKASVERSFGSAAMNDCRPCPVIDALNDAGSGDDASAADDDVASSVRKRARY